MRIVRYRTEIGGSYGLVQGDRIVPLVAAPWHTGGEPLPAGDPVSRGAVSLVPPVEPGKILGVGRNYRTSVEEAGQAMPAEPRAFLKAPSSLLAHGGMVLLPRESECVHFEGELVVVVGRRARRVPPEAWREVVFGLTLAVDVTARDLQESDAQWWRAKGFDTFCPLGPAVVAGLDPSDLLLETFVNGERRQAGRTSALRLGVPELVSYLSQAMTLEPGDLILTGTPAGAGLLSPGDRVEVRAEKIGSLSVSVAREG